MSEETGRRLWASMVAASGGTELRGWEDLSPATRQSLSNAASDFEQGGGTLPSSTAGLPGGGQHGDDRQPYVPNPGEPAAPPPLLAAPAFEPLAVEPPAMIAESPAAEPVEDMPAGPVAATAGDVTVIGGADGDGDPWVRLIIDGFPNIDWPADDAHSVAEMLSAAAHRAEFESQLGGYVVQSQIAAGRAAEQATELAQAAIVGLRTFASGA